MKLHDEIQLQAIDPDAPVIKKITLGELREWMCQENANEQLTPQQRGAITRAKKKAEKEANESK